MTVLNGFPVLQLGGGMAAAVCGRLLADAGADVSCIGGGPTEPLAAWLNRGKTVLPADTAVAAVAARVRMILCQGGPAALAAQGHDAAALRDANPKAAIVLISPFSQTGPWADRPASDLTLFCAGGIAAVLTGQVDDLSEPPQRPVGLQSAFIGGIAAACAGMHAALLPDGGVIDVSIQETLATLSMTELTRAGLGLPGRPRRRHGDGNGATVCILPASDGYVAISPRENHQWAAWLAVMGAPDWGGEPRFATKPDRVENWDVLHALMSDWSRRHPKQWIADAAQEAHVPSFPLREAGESLQSAQFEHRNFFRDFDWNGAAVKTPGSAFGLGHRRANAEEEPAPGALPLAGVRVLDFSWVIAGPTTTRYLAAMGAEVIKVEAPGRGDPGRASELHTVLGQGKRAITLNLKSPDGVRVAQALAARCDILIENFGTGVMERFGLGAEALRECNPGLIYISASGLGRTGPEAGAVAYGTLLQCYAGFAGLNAAPGTAPRVGMAWLDPMCGLKLAFIAAAALWHRRTAGQSTRVDFSMVEALLWTMADPLLAAQIPGYAGTKGNGSAKHSPHGLYPARGEDAWIGVAVTSQVQWRALSALVPALLPMAALEEAERLAQSEAIEAVLTVWLADRDPWATAELLTDAGIPAAALARFEDLAKDPHLTARGFWETEGERVLPGLPWQANFGRASGSAPELGADTDAVLRDVLALPQDEIDALRNKGAFS